MAAMSVIGIDFGNESCYVAVAKSGGIETIANDYSLRATPTYIAFSEKNRILGVAAKNQQVTNMKNTVYGLKRLLGRSYSDKQVQFEKKHLPFHIEKEPGDKIGIKVQYCGKEHTFSPEQCVAMLFTKLKDTSANALQTLIKDCVISVPSYYTQAERQALLDAATIADLNVLCLLNETTATALAYGIYKQDLPAVEEPPRNVIFVDCGYTSLQVAACQFHKGQLKMLATASDSNLGGRNIDYILADYFSNMFLEKFRVDARSNQRAYIRLLAEVEKIKKQMSANSTTLPLNIECFMEDKDVRGEIKRDIMEGLCEELFGRVRIALEQCLKESGLTKENIQAVEIVGGSTRIPAIKKIITEVFDRAPSTTLNQDEAVSRGCALQCAILSPAVRVRDFKVEDVQSYAVDLRYGPNESVTLLQKSDKSPITRKITIHRSESFTMEASYAEEVPYSNRLIGKWHIKDVSQHTNGKSEPITVMFKVENGILNAKRALLDLKETVDAVEPMEVDAAEQNGEQQPQADENATAGENGGDDKPKKKVNKKIVDLSIEAETYGSSKTELQNFIEVELSLIMNDKKEKERADARNTLEEYVYELRGKLSSEDELGLYVLEDERHKLIQELDDMENWLYDEGEDCEKQKYKDRYAALKAKGGPIEKRRQEADGRQYALEQFGKVIQQKQKIFSRITSGEDERSPHFTTEELDKVKNQLTEASSYFQKISNEFANLRKHMNPPYTIEEIFKTLQTFQSLVDPILNKPMPKAPSPPKETKPEEQKAGAEPTPDGQENHMNQQEADMNVD